MSSPLLGVTGPDKKIRRNPHCEKKITENFLLKISPNVVFLLRESHIFYEENSKKAINNLKKMKLKQMMGESIKLANSYFLALMKFFQPEKLLKTILSEEEERITILKLSRIMLKEAFRIESPFYYSLLSNTLIHFLRKIGKVDKALELTSRAIKKSSVWLKKATNEEEKDMADIRINVKLLCLLLITKSSILKEKGGLEEKSKKNLDQAKILAEKYCQADPEILRYWKRASRRTNSSARKRTRRDGNRRKFYSVDKRKKHSNIFRIGSNESSSFESSRKKRTKHKRKRRRQSQHRRRRDNSCDYRIVSGKKRLGFEEDRDRISQARTPTFKVISIGSPKSRANKGQTYEIIDQGEIVKNIGNLSKITNELHGELMKLKQSNDGNFHEDKHYDNEILDKLEQIRKEQKELKETKKVIERKLKKIEDFIEQEPQIDGDLNISSIPTISRNQSNSKSIHSHRKESDPKKNFNKKLTLGEDLKNTKPPNSSPKISSYVLNVDPLTSTFNNYFKILLEKMKKDDKSESIYSNQFIHLSNSTEIFRIIYKLSVIDQECILNLSCYRKSDKNMKDLLCEEELNEEQIKFIFEKLKPTEVLPEDFPINCFTHFKYLINFVLAYFCTIQKNNQGEFKFLIKSRISSVLDEIKMNFMRESCKVVLIHLNDRVCRILIKEDNKKRLTLAKFDLILSPILMNKMFEVPDGNEKATLLRGILSGIKKLSKEEIVDMKKNASVGQNLYPLKNKNKVKILFEIF